MTYNKVFFVFISGIVIAFFIAFCMIAKLFFLEKYVCTLVLMQIFLLGYLVFVSLGDIKKEK